MNNSSKWLCRCSSRWDKHLDRRGLLEIKVHPKVEDLKVWLAYQALPLVEVLAQGPPLQPTGDHNGLASRKDFVAGKLDMIRQIIMELDNLADPDAIDLTSRNDYSTL